MALFLSQTVAGGRPTDHASKMKHIYGPERAVSGENWKKQAQEVGREVKVIWRVFKDPRTPWYARLIAACAVGYVFSPIQLIPSFIPVIGFLDDFVVLAVGFNAVRRLAGAGVVRDCREQAASAEKQPDDGRQMLGKPTATIVVGIWLLATVAATVWLYR
jgi:uncharacterized membrane protein YkvA (DUF1232 family)